MRLGRENNILIRLVLSVLSAVAMGSILLSVAAMAATGGGVGWVGVTVLAGVTGLLFGWVIFGWLDARANRADPANVQRLRQLKDQLYQSNEKLEHSVMVKTFDLLLTQDVTIMSLVSLAETRDSETGQHIERTRKYVKILAEQLRDHPRFHDFLDDETIRLLHRSAPLHDIGKVGIADRILLKPGKLAPASYEEMKKHTILGGDALGWAEQRLGTNSFLQIARDIAYFHHEHWDGGGYPYGISGEKIPIAARLMALADVYDALRSERRYKSSFDHQRAREIILAQKGKQFDPAVVEAFVAAEQEFRQIADQSDQDGQGRYVTDHTALKGDGHIPILEEPGQ